MGITCPILEWGLLDWERIWDGNKLLVRWSASQQTALLAGAGTVLPSSNPTLEGNQVNRAAVSCLASSSAFTTARYCS